MARIQKPVPLFATTLVLSCAAFAQEPPAAGRTAQEPPTQPVWKCDAGATTLVPCTTPPADARRVSVTYSAGPGAEPGGSRNASGAPPAPKALTRGFGERR